MEKLDFLKKICFLKAWCDYDLKTLSYNFKSKVYYLGNFLYREGDKASGFFLIKKGKFKIFKQMDQKSSKSFKLAEISDVYEGETLGEE